MDIVKYGLIAVLAVMLMVVWLKKPRVEYKETIVERIDTLTIEKPVPQYVYIKSYEFFETVKDSLIYIHDTDSVYIPIPIEVKEYRDSSYFCRISGYHPNLEQLYIYQKTIEHTIERTIKQKPFLTFGVGVSFGYNPITRQFEPIVGANITIPLYSIYIR